MPSAKRLVAVVGTNIGDRRYEPGDTIPANVGTDKQRKYLINEAFAAQEDTNLPKAESVVLEEADVPVVVAIVAPDPDVEV